MNGRNADAAEMLERFSVWSIFIVIFVFAFSGILKLDTYSTCWFISHRFMCWHVALCPAWLQVLLCSVLTAVIGSYSCLLRADFYGVVFLT